MKRHTQGKWQINKIKPTKQRGAIAHGEQGGISYYSGNAIMETHYLITSKSALKTSRLPGDFLGIHIARLNTGYKGDDEAEANAKLIAAAPEMLDRLIEIFEEKELNEKMLSKIHQTINKAKGEEIK